MYMKKGWKFQKLNMIYIINQEKIWKKLNISVCKDTKITLLIPIILNENMQKFITDYNTEQIEKKTRKVDLGGIHN